MTPAASWSLAEALADVGRAVRDAVGGRRRDDGAVVRTAGGDDVFGIDARADEALVEALVRACGERWPGTLVLEGYDDPLAVGDAAGEWRYLADPVDGSRPWLAGKRSAWVLLGAGRHAATLADLEVGACAELPAEAGLPSRVAWAVRGEGARLDGPGRLEPLALAGEADLAHRFVSVQRFAPGSKGAIGAWEDDVLGDLPVYEDPYLCSGGQLLEVAFGREAAVLDPRPLVRAGTMAAHPYDLAAWVVAAEVGVVVEALPPGPLSYPLDCVTPVAWAAYCSEAVAAALRARLSRARPARSATSRPGTG